MKSYGLVVLITLLAYTALAMYTGKLAPVRLVQGESMEPALHEGDIIILKSESFLEIGRGDVIAYEAPEPIGPNGKRITILHRVLKSELGEQGRVLITKGDNSGVDPWPIMPEYLRGRMALRLPAVGKPLILLNSTGGMLSNIGRSESESQSSLLPNIEEASVQADNSKSDNTSF